MDIFLYNGTISRGDDYKFIKYVSENKASDSCLVILVTPGGDPDAAYKMARYLQYKYKSYNVMISGLCKSAGTLFAIGANELIFAPYGELGPLDVQLSKTDNLAGMESGLNISEAFSTLETRARETFIGVTLDVIGSSGGVVSFQTASHAATEIVGSLYGPIFARIDPEEVGSRSRAMRIGADYGKRLNLKWNNMKQDALDILSQTYSSHGFVIDFLEAQSLFNRVRVANEQEMENLLSLGDITRFPQRGLTVRKLQINGTTEKGGKDHEKSKASDRRQGETIAANGNNGLDPEKPIKVKRAPARRNKAAASGHNEAAEQERLAGE